MSDFQLVIPVMIHHQDKEPFAGEFSVAVRDDVFTDTVTITASREYFQDIKDNFDNGYYTLDTTRTVTFVPKEESKPKPKLVKPDFGGLEQYVGYQENNIVKGDIIDIGLVFFLKVNNNDGKMSISIERDTVELEYDESEIQEKILETFEQFPSYKIPPFEGKEEYQWEKYNKKFGFLSIPWYRKFNVREKYYFYSERQASAKIAMNTRRGVGNTRFRDTLFYKGANEYDCPIIVVKKGDLYGIFKHPNFEQYGFNLIDG